jgi:hypothetical protein
LPLEASLQAKQPWWGGQSTKNLVQFLGSHVLSCALMCSHVFSCALMRSHVLPKTCLRVPSCTKHSTQQSTRSTLNCWHKPKHVNPHPHSQWHAFDLEPFKHKSNLVHPAVRGAQHSIAQHGTAYIACTACLQAHTQSIN